jgi:hypothetical protein
MKEHHYHRMFAIAAAVAILGTACSDDESSDPTTPAETAAPDTAAPDTAAPVTDAPTTTLAGFEGDLIGIFEITAGACDGAAVSGSYFQMTGPDGSLVPNADSPCAADQTFSLLTPGTDGGLATGSHQPAPDPAFDEAGNALANAIAEPTLFFGVAFGLATDETIDAPTLSAADGTLSGQVSAFTAFYGGSPFNQGSTEVTGTIDPVTGEFVLDWSSLISGGPFDGFTGGWHLEGTFTAA